MFRDIPYVILVTFNFFHFNRVPLHLPHQLLQRLRSSWPQQRRLRQRYLGRGRTVNPFRTIAPSPLEVGRE